MDEQGELLAQLAAVFYTTRCSHAACHQIYFNTVKKIRKIILYNMQ